MTPVRAALDELVGWAAAHPGTAVWLVVSGRMELVEAERLLRFRSGVLRHGNRYRVDAGELGSSLRILAVNASWDVLHGVWVDAYRSTCALPSPLELELARRRRR